MMQISKQSVNNLKNIFVRNINIFKPHSKNKFQFWHQEQLEFDKLEKIHKEKLTKEHEIYIKDRQIYEISRQFQIKTNHENRFKLNSLKSICKNIKLEKKKFDKLKEKTQKISLNEKKNSISEFNNETYLKLLDKEANNWIYDKETLNKNIDKYNIIPDSVDQTDYQMNLQKMSLLNENKNYEEIDSQQFEIDVTTIKNKFMIPLQNQIKYNIRNITQSKQHELLDDFISLKNQIQTNQISITQDELDEIEQQQHLLFKAINSLTDQENLVKIRTQLNGILDLIVSWEGYTRVLHQNEYELEHQVKLNDAKYGRNPETEFIDQLIKREQMNTDDSRERLKTIEKFDLFENNEHESLISDLKQKISDKIDSTNTNPSMSFEDIQFQNPSYHKILKVPKFLEDAKVKSEESSNLTTRNFRNKKKQVSDQEKDNLNNLQKQLSQAKKSHKNQFQNISSSNAKGENGVNQDQQENDFANELDKINITNSQNDINESVQNSNSNIKEIDKTMNPGQDLKLIELSTKVANIKNKIIKAESEIQNDDFKQRLFDIEIEGQEKFIQQFDNLVEDYNHKQVSADRERFRRNNTILRMAGYKFATYDEVNKILQSREQSDIINILLSIIKKDIQEQDKEHEFREISNDCQETIEYIEKLGLPQPQLFNQVFERFSQGEVNFDDFKFEN